MIASIRSFVSNSITITNIKEIFLLNFLVILKHPLQNYKKILKKYFFGTSCIAKLVNVGSHERVNFIEKSG